MRRKINPPAPANVLPQSIEIGVHLEADVRPVVESRSFQVPVRDAETQRLDEMERRMGRSTGPGDISGILRNFRLVQNHLERRSASNGWSIGGFHIRFGFDSGFIGPSGQHGRQDSSRFFRPRTPHLNGNSRGKPPAAGPDTGPAAVYRRAKNLRHAEAVTHWPRTSPSGRRYTTGHPGSRKDELRQPLHDAL